MTPVMVGALALLLSAALSTPGPFVLVNNSGGPLTEISIRPGDGSAGWRPLGPAAVGPGARESVASPGGLLCAFDVRAKVGGSVAIWSSVNLCDVKIVTLNRRTDGTLWVDYD